MEESKPTTVKRDPTKCDGCGRKLAAFVFGHDEARCVATQTTPVRGLVTTRHGAVKKLRPLKPRRHGERRLAWRARSGLL